MLSGFWNRGQIVAPHVGAALFDALGGDPVGMAETAELLTAAQRLGHRMLPDPLPLAPSASRGFERTALPEPDRALLLAASLSTDDAVGLLVDLVDAPLERIAERPAGEHLALAHGVYRFRDPRFRGWLQQIASPAELRNAHRALERAFRRRRDPLRAQWHRARGALRREPAIVPTLLTAAQSVCRSGDAAGAYRLAVEAAEHATGALQDRARLVAGTAALAAGCVADAVDWLRGLFPSASLRTRRDALQSLMIAEAQLSGTSPSIESAGGHRPTGDDGVEWLWWTRTAAVAALLCAERGDAAGMRRWLHETRMGDARSGVAGGVRDPAVALCLLVAGEAARASASASRGFCDAVADALSAALDGDLEAGLRALARDGRLGVDDPLVRECGTTPLMRAHLVVLEALLHVWRGAFGPARDRLLAASLRLPIALPFAGLGIVLARSLDIAVHGRPGPIASALTAAAPDGARVDRLAEAGVRAYLAGAADAAADSIRLWQDRGAAGSPFFAPVLDEVGPLAPPSGTGRIAPPELVEAAALRRRLRGIGARDWSREYFDIAVAGRRIRSPFARARLEAMLGAACAGRGRLEAGERHLRMARTLFAEAGAHAWRADVDARLGRLRRSSPGLSAGPDPLAACRALWQAQLTQRELEVAMRVVAGGGNREIAAELEVSVRTVEVHVGRVMAKLGVRGRVELTALAYRVGRYG